MSTYYFKREINQDMVDAVADEVANLQSEDIAKIVMRAKLVKADQRDDRERVLASCESQLQIIRKDRKRKLEDFMGMKVNADGPDILPLAQLKEMFGNLKVFGMDITTGSNLSFVPRDPERPDWEPPFSNSMLDFMKFAYFGEYSMVILGPPEMGKTPLASGICSVIARIRNTHPDRPYFVQTSTLDNLGRVNDQISKENPLLMDDFTPSETQGVGSSGKACNMEQMKHLLNQKGSETMSARYKDIC